MSCFYFGGKRNGQCYVRGKGIAEGHGKRAFRSGGYQRGEKPQNLLYELNGAWAVTNLLFLPRRLRAGRR